MSLFKLFRHQQKFSLAFQVMTHVDVLDVTVKFPGLFLIVEDGIVNEVDVPSGEKNTRPSYRYYTTEEKGTTSINREFRLGDWLVVDDDRKKIYPYSDKKFRELFDTDYEEGLNE